MDKRQERRQDKIIRRERMRRMKKRQTDTFVETDTWAEKRDRQTD